MGGSKIFWALLPIVFAAALFVISLTQIPDIHKDAQYYLQSAILWNSGKVSFAGSWIGSRAFSVWIYHMAFSAFGYNVDALSVVLSIIKLLTATALFVVVARTVDGLALKAIVSIAAAVLVFAMPLMNTPATDNIGLLFLSALWASWLVGGRTRQLIVPLLAGIGLSVRSEIIMLPALLAAAGILSGRLHFHWRRLLLSVAMFALGIFATGQIWNTWVPVEKPAQYSGAIAMFRPLIEYGMASNGPFSTRLFDVARQDKDGPLNYWEAIGSAYAEIGPLESNALLTAAGKEAVMRNALPYLKGTLSNAWKLLDAPGAFEVKTADANSSSAGLGQKLSEFDIVRVRASASFGGDFTYPTRTLIDGRIGWVESLRSAVPMMPLSIKLFGGIFVISFLAGSCATIIFRDPSWMAVPMFGVAVCLLASLSQGVIYRYVAPALLLNFVAAATSAIALLARQDRLPYRLRPAP